MKVRLRASARRDLREIWEYRALRHGEDAADAYLRDIEAAMARLADYPELGASRAELGPDLRSLPGAGASPFLLRLPGSGVGSPGSPQGDGCAAAPLKVHAEAQRRGGQAANCTRSQRLP